MMDGGDLKHRGRFPSTEQTNPKKKKKSNKVSTDCDRINDSNNEPYDDKSPVLPSAHRRLASHIPGYRTQNKEERICDFVSQNIKHSECKHYIPNKEVQKEGNDLCCCGRDRWWHKERKLPEGEYNNPEWTPEVHTHPVDADTFGVIRFSGFGGKHLDDAPYIRTRVDKKNIKTQVENVWTLLRDHWHIQSPKLIISITGGAKRFKITDKQSFKQSFKKALIQTATSTGAWIITGGYNEGIMKVVGEAVHEYSSSQRVTARQIVTLGIGTWGICDNKDMLVGKKGKGMFPADYDAIDLTNTSLDKKPMASLDPNHTYFILVDDGTENQVGKELEFRAKFEKHVSENSEEGNRDVEPVVHVMINGGEHTLKTAVEAVKQNIPVIVAKDTGRMADFIAKEFVKMTDFNEVLKNGKEKLFPKYEISGDSILPNLETLSKHKHLVTVNENIIELDQTILNALLDAHSRPEDGLKMALAWNLCIVARNRILTDDWRNKMPTDKNVQTKMLYEALFQALLQNKTDFVQLFLDNGVDLKRFLDCKALRDLYQIALAKSDDHITEVLDLLLKEQQVKDYHSKNLLKCVGAVIAELLGDYEEVLYQDRKYDMDIRTDISESYFDDKKKIARRLNMHEPAFADPARHLFIWSVLLNRIETAELFWKLLKDHIGGALMAVTLFKALAKRAKKSSEMMLHTDLVNHAKRYEEHAVGVLSECYKEDKNLTHQLLTRHLQSWNGTTLFWLAETSTQMKFMAQTACQTKLKKIWLGRMAYDTPTTSIMLCLFLPFLLKIVIDWRPADDTTDHLKTQKDLEHQKTPTAYARKERKKITEDSPSWIEATRLYYTSPVTKFMFNTLSFGIFLALYSFFALVRLQDTDSENWLSVEEIILWIWVLALVLEEIRQMLQMKHLAIWTRLKIYHTNKWNIFDTVVYTMFGVSVLLRFVLHGDNFVVARVFYCLTLMGFYIRFLQVFYISKNIGPKVIMIQRMLYDLLFFIFIMLIVLVSYGVLAQALRYPNSDANWSLLKDVLYMPYWQMYGELFLDDLEGNVVVDGINDTTIDCSQDPENVACPRTSPLVLFIFACYMMISNVLLLNLLVAMFSFTFERVQRESEDYWLFYRYHLIQDYFFRPAFAPPLIIFNHLYRAAKSLSHEPKISNDFRVIYEIETDKRLTAFERLGMENYLYSAHETDQLNNNVIPTSESIVKVVEDLDRLRGKLEYRTEKETFQSTDETAPTTKQSSRNLSESHQLQDLPHILDGMLACTKQTLELLQQLRTQMGGIPPPDFKIVVRSAALTPIPSSTTYGRAQSWPANAEDRGPISSHPVEDEQQEPKSSASPSNSPRDDDSGD